MNRKQAANLKRGDVVRHVIDDVQGEVDAIGEEGTVYIVWEDGEVTHNLPIDMCEIDKIS